MMNPRQQFFRHLAQTSSSPIGLEIVRAAGIYQYAADGKRYTDLISGFSVANIGHSHPKVVEAVQQQAASYMHLIVYGEFVQQPQTAYATRLASLLPSTLDTIYFTNSGAEATEGAMKLAKRATGRARIFSFRDSYHGSTQGALSLMGGEEYKSAYRPLLPGVAHFAYGGEEIFNGLDETVAAVFVEPVQAESGITAPPAGWLEKLREACSRNGILLVFDEIQTGFGRTGTLWAFEQSGVVPDILLLGKALGGGMPLGAFVASRERMQLLTHHPVLGHITTFGGHPVSCAAGLAALNVLLEEELIAQGIANGKLLQDWMGKYLPGQPYSSYGCWASWHRRSFEKNYTHIKRCWSEGIITDWFLFAADKLRIAPPLSMSANELAETLETMSRLL